jgi:hypothetical protein
MQELLRGVTLSDWDDEISWGLTTNKQFSTRSLHRFLTSGGFPNKLTRKIWKCKVPLKLNIFYGRYFRTESKLHNN